VDLDKAGELVRRIQPLVHSTYDEGVITEIGGFGGLYALDCKEGDRPVLVSSTDGVGTKLKVAFWAGRHETVGIDLVAMCVNDILVQGARPLFFLDYLSMGRMDLDILEQVVTGIAQGCKEARCALIGGETAEMPGFYEANEYDMAGFAVGVVDRSRIKDGSAIREGDRIIGLASSGLHSNGYSLVRRILIEQMGLQPESFLDECRRTAAEELLEPTRIYVRPVLDLLERFNVNGMVHITGGGFHDNIPRVLPRSCRALLYEDSWDIPPIFDFLREKGGISSEEMGHVFNNGIGYILVVGAEEARAAMERLEMLGQKAYQIGEIAAKEGNEPTVAFIRR
jgi:phosphoribosylformylglycinamidine cyclo-ligase